MAVTADEFAVKQKFFPKLARVLARVPLADELVAAYYAALDRATPLKARGILIGALAYFILPVDALPDVVLGLGFTDDMAVLLAAYNIVRNHVTEEHRRRARETIARIRAGAPISA
ncbi:YkvA family protein [Aestuariivirga sp.]|uniref:YkvA family protein n=1 Tax=Aestuariivirga sp. TaxID=2650926 RepID=UPI0025C53B1F|nr:YkvA family protein [Aestuariivirga sp.]MCA3554701.1 DUF1232 domain-containing protein [Aestuariivirga sp.]